MKEIGEKLRETREGMGISIEEAAEDLKLRPSHIENIEDGNIEAFKDIFFLKYFIRDYAKYLGLNYEDMVDEFNEYIFDYTSKISIEDIKKAKNNHNDEKNKRIMSPYTIEYRKRIKVPPIVIYIIIALLLIVIGYLIVSIINVDKFGERDLGINKEVIHEFTK